MTETPDPTTAIAEPMRSALRGYIEHVRELAGGGLKGVTLFGALAAGTFDPRRHTARTVMVVEEVDLSLLRRLSEHGLKFGKARIAAPLVMTPAYIKASLDTFPLELIEIHQKHMTLTGEDFFGDLVFDDPHVRLQCERELKVILIGLRQGLLAAAGREKLISALETDAGEGLVRTMRGMLWLKDVKDGKPAREVVGEVEKIVDRRLSGVRAALDADAPHDWAQFEALYRDVEALGEAVDGW